MKTPPKIEPADRPAENPSEGTGRQRKMWWIGLCAALVPPVWVIATGALATFARTSAVELPWRYQDTGTVVIAVVGLGAVLACVTGIRRGWNTAPALRFGGKALAGVFGLAVLMWMATSGGPRMRTSTIDKVVLNNARQLAAAAEAHFAEKGATSCALDDLVGSDKYVKALTTVAGETYPQTYTRGGVITITGLAGARTLTYAP
jgi:type IV pilus assembly protein PilA